MTELAIILAQRSRDGTPFRWISTLDKQHVVCFVQIQLLYQTDSGDNFDGILIMPDTVIFISVN